MDASLLQPLASGEGIVFLILALGIVALAITCMTRRNPVTAVMSLVGAFFGLAGLYATLSAHFLAVLQVLVYAGAIMVLFIFVVMILNRDDHARLEARPAPRVLGVLSGAYLLLVFFRVAIPATAVAPMAVPDSYGTVAAIGDVLFRQFLFPFEAISLLLLVAIVGGVVVSRSSRKASEAVDAAEKRIAITELSLHDYPEPRVRGRRRRARCPRRRGTSLNADLLLSLPVVRDLPHRDHGGAAAAERPHRPHGRRAPAQRRQRRAPLLRPRPRGHQGHVFAFLIIALAAAEAAVGLAILVGLFRSRQTINLDEASLMKR